MNKISLFVLCVLVSATAHADDRIVDCNIPDGDIAEVKIMKSSSGALSAELLTGGGSSLNGGAIDAASWQKRDITFSYGKGFNAGRLRFYQEKDHKWWFQEFDMDSKFASVSGNADCLID
jgi:hypothetical protein